MIPADWPHRSHSDIVGAGGLSWHVQRFGAGPQLLAIHGTAASTHSFRDVAAQLADRFEIVMADLPGHGFSSAMDAPGLPRVAEALGGLLRALSVEPAVVAGHSAGAAIALRMTLDRIIEPAAVVGLAPALKPYGGAADGLASGLVKLAFLNPVAPRLFARRADPDRVAKLIARTGSRLDAEGAGYYARLLQRPDHVAGALRLMAHWKLRPLQDDLPRLQPEATLVLGENDHATPPGDADTASRTIPARRVETLAGLGHLAHEEDPAAAAAAVIRAAERNGVLTAPAPERRSARKAG